MNEAATDHAEGFAATVTELQKRDSSDVIKILFWAVVLVCCLLAIVVAPRVWYTVRPSNWCGSTFRIPRKLVRQNLDSHFALEICISCPIYLSHSAFADQPRDLVGAQLLPNLK